MKKVGYILVGCLIVSVYNSHKIAKITKKILKDTSLTDFQKKEYIKYPNLYEDDRK